MGHVEGCCPAGSEVLHRDQSEAEDKKGEGSEELGRRERPRSGAESWALARSPPGRVLPRAGRWARCRGPAPAAAPAPRLLSPALASQVAWQGSGGNEKFFFDNESVSWVGQVAAVGGE